MNICRKAFLGIALALLTCLLMSFTCAASENTTKPITLLYNDNPIEGAIYANETAYAPYRALVSAIEPEVTYNWSRGVSTAYGKGIEIKAGANNNYIEVNGRVFYNEKAPNLNINGTLYVPVESLANCYTLAHSFNLSRMRACVAGTPSPAIHADKYYDEDSLYWLSHIISAESRGEPFRGQIAVGNVILARVGDGSFPDTIYDVIFDKRFGIQFTPAYSGTIHKTPSESAVLAAKIVLEGTEVIDALYFCAARGASGSWMDRNRTYIETIGNHVFYW
ncbi:MAG: cell wall hydrolase [Clostridia bacterium]|nr:cell wall hydrolase [Clostridia bacterium]